MAGRTPGVSWFALEPQGDSVRVLARLPGLPGDLSLQLPELISDTDRRLVYCHANLQAGVRWKRLAGGALRSTWSQPGLASYQLNATSVEDGLQLDWIITNLSAETWVYSAGTVCMDMHGFADFHDPNLERVLLRSGGRWIPARDVVTDIRQPEGNWFLPLGKAPCNLMRAMAEASSREPAGGGWRLSEFHPDQAIIATTSRDGRRVLAMAWHDARYMIVNIGANHGCTDVCPYLGDIPAGQTVRVKGRILCYEGELQMLMGRYEADLASRTIGFWPNVKRRTAREP